MLAYGLMKEEKVPDIDIKRALKRKEKFVHMPVLKMLIMAAILYPCCNVLRPRCIKKLQISFIST
ncbi:MAG: hypothetical protein C4527_11485 [Candidatus Omnitrophota bacterium]|nr:MAG: hypothetical protein C4527_11485 [Candidatus Omnitrophota bacterium]